MALPPLLLLMQHSLLQHAAHVRSQLWCWMLLLTPNVSHTKYDAYHIGAPHWFHKGEAYPCIFIKCVCVCVWATKDFLWLFMRNFFYWRACSSTIGPRCNAESKCRLSSRTCLKVTKTCTGARISMCMLIFPLYFIKKVWWGFFSPWTESTHHQFKLLAWVKEYVISEK